jgi:hypothetical protein
MRTLAWHCVNRIVEVELVETLVVNCQVVCLDCGEKQKSFIEIQFKVSNRLRRCRQTVKNLIRFYIPQFYVVLRTREQVFRIFTTELNV